MDFLLHPENFDRMIGSGQRVKRWLRRRAEELSVATAHLTDPDVSIVIRTRNDELHIQRLFDDIQAQEFQGAVEIILVDTESTDDTVTYARSKGAKIISLTQAEFTYPLALNKGFKAASHPWVVTLVGHSSLTNKFFLKSLTYWTHRQNVAGLYAVPLPNWNMSFWERTENLLRPDLWLRPKQIHKQSIGIMGANCSILRRDVWEALGYDERYAAGGEDADLARRMLAAGHIIVREPLLAVHHSHGLSFQNSVRQWLHWMEVGKARPQAFETARVHARRPDLRERT